MLTLRPATPADALSVAAVHVRSWQSGYRGLIAQSYLDSLRAEDRAARYTFGSSDPDQPSTTVAELDGEVRGFASIGPCGDDGARTGEILAVYVDPPVWGQGVGRLLIEDARARLQARSCTSAVLWVLVGNDRAERFYRADGWMADDFERTVEIWGVEIVERRFRRRLP